MILVPHLREVIRPPKNTPEMIIFGFGNFCISAYPSRVHTTEQLALHRLRVTTSRSAPKEFSKEPGLLLSQGACTKLQQRVKNLIQLLCKKKTPFYNSIKSDAKKLEVIEYQELLFHVIVSFRTILCPWSYNSCKWVSTKFWC